MSNRSLDRGLGKFGPDRSNPPGDGGADAGTLGMYVFVIALAMFFAGLLVVYFLMRRLHQPWPPKDFPALPWSLWLSTIDIAVSSFAMQASVAAARRGDTAALRRNIVITLVLGVAFLALQSYAWMAIFQHVTASANLQSTYLKMFYILTGLHAAHVVGGLIPLLMVTVAAFKGYYGRRKNAGVRYTAIYWHFLGAAWFAVFAVTYLI